jgi:hypothetical protein
MRKKYRPDVLGARIAVCSSGIFSGSPSRVAAMMRCISLPVSCRFVNACLFYFALIIFAATAAFFRASRCHLE